jgi:hypothetical protein
MLIQSTYNTLVSRLCSYYLHVPSSLTVPDFKADHVTPAQGIPEQRERAHAHVANNIHVLLYLMHLAAVAPLSRYPCAS